MIQLYGISSQDEDKKEFEQKFGQLASLKGKQVCGFGKITEYKQHLQITLKKAQYLSLMSK